MWVLRKPCAPGGSSRRLFTLSAMTLFMAVFALIGPLSQPVAAIDAIWSGDVLTYDGQTYSPTDEPPDRAGTPNEYQWVSTTGGDTVALVFYFGDNPGNQREATLIEYEVVGGTYTPRGSPQTITVTRDLGVDSNGAAQGDDWADGTNTCNTGGGLGWVICPLANYMSDGIDWLYGIVETFLEVQTINNTDSGIYQIWGLIKNIANVCFILVFLVIVYSQLTGAGYSNYNIKDMIPRLVIGAILVNVSFWICALAVDVSNLLGYSIQAIFVSVRENVIMNVDAIGESWSWSVLTGVILAGGAAAGGAGIAAAAGGGGTALSFLLLAALIPAAFSILVAFTILAARQALIVVLTMISPLAFVAFVLPNTQNLFDRWRKTFTTLLVFFPIFAFVFGGSQLAGTAILNSSEDAQDPMKLPIILIGLATMVVPLVITPLIIRFSSGLLGQIANLTNSKSRGLVDRAQNWARDNADVHKSNKLANTARDLERRKNGELSRFSPRGVGLGRLGLRFDQQKRRREATKKDNEAYLENRQESDRQKQIANRKGRYGRTMQERAIDTHDMHKKAEVYKGQVEAEGDAHWRKRFDPTSHHFDQSIHASELATREFKGQAKRDEDKWEAIVREMEAGVNSYKGAEYDNVDSKLRDYLRNQDMDNRAQRMGELTFDISQQAKRKEYADVKIKADEVSRLRADEDARAYAGGIDELGKHKVLAKARSENSALHMENVKTYKSVFSNEGYTTQELMEVIEHGKLRGGQPGEANAIQKHAAIQRVMMDIGNNWAVQKVVDWSASQGMTLDADGVTYRDLDGNVLGDSNAAEVEDRRDLQQIVNDGLSNSQNKVSYISNTMRANMESGQFTYDKNEYENMSEYLVMYEAGKSKYSAERLASMDPDEISRMVQVFRNPQRRSELSDDERNAILGSIRQAQTDPQLKGRIKERERGLMNVLAAHLDPTDNRPITEKEHTYWVHDVPEGDKLYNVPAEPYSPGAVPRTVGVQAPKTYTVDKQVDTEYY